MRWTRSFFSARRTIQPSHYPSTHRIGAWVASLPGPQIATYEAGPTGFGVYRQLLAAGIDCQVAAPSKVQRPVGDRVKTDAHDVEHLAKLLRLGQVVVVRVPSVEAETVRDVVRAREDTSPLLACRMNEAAPMTRFATNGSS